MRTSLAVAAKEFLQTVELIDHILDLARDKPISRSALEELGRALPDINANSSAQLFHKAILVLSRSFKDSYLIPGEIDSTPEEIDDTMAELRLLLEAPLRNQPVLGPSNPGTVIDWYYAAMGNLAESLVGLAFVEYVRIKAGNFGVRQEAERVRTKLEGTRNLLNWITQSPESENVPVPN